MYNQQQRELESLVKEVIKRRDRIIPVIGDYCFVGYIDEGEKLVPLQEWLAVTLLGDDLDCVVRKKIATLGYEGQDLLREEYRRITDNNSFINYKEDIISCVDEGIKEGKIFLRNDVKDFLRAGKFEVIATTCPYHILEYELESVNLKYSISSFSPLSVTDKSKSEATLKLPSIYQLFGDCEGEFVSGEEDLLKFLHYLNQTDTEKGFGASPLVKYIKDKGQDNKGIGLLMPIGCDNLPNWLFRFLWYPFSQERIVGTGTSNRGGVWHKYSDDEDFYKFLRTYEFKTFSKSTAGLNDEDSDDDPVLKRLTSEFLNSETTLQTYASSKLNVQWNDTEEWDFFISYASEDADIAGIIYETLTIDCGLKVWMDNRGRVNPGDIYWDAIQHGIEHSKRFIFIITETYLAKAIDKLHRYDFGVAPTGVYQEIELIKHHFLSKKLDDKKGYSYPLIIEGTKVTYTDLNGALHENETLANGVLEKLPLSKEYKMLQTEVLFSKIQDFICNKEYLKENLTKLFSNFNKF